MDAVPAGIISHLAQLRELIDRRIVVARTQSGSRVSIPGTCGEKFNPAGSNAALTFRQQSDILIHCELEK